MIREYRKLEKQWHLLHTELEYVSSEMRERKAQICRPGFGSIQGMYAVYREVWSAFVYAVDFASNLREFNASERDQFQAGLRDTAREQAHLLHQAEKASQLATAMTTRSGSRLRPRWTAL